MWEGSSSDVVNLTSFARPPNQRSFSHKCRCWTRFAPPSDVQEGSVHTNITPTWFEPHHDTVCLLGIICHLSTIYITIGFTNFHKCLRNITRHAAMRHFEGKQFLQSIFWYLKCNCICYLLNTDTYCLLENNQKTDASNWCSSVLCCVWIEIQRK